MHLWYDMLLLELPDNVARVDLNCPGAPQVVVVGEGIPRREDTPCRLTLETPTTLRCMHTHTHTQMNTKYMKTSKNANSCKRK